MRYLIDTCVISEFSRRSPNKKVIAWLDEQDESALFLSVLNLGEIQKGVTKLPDGDRKDELYAWLKYDLMERFAGRILEFDLITALYWGEMQGEAENRGIALPLADSLIAAVARVNGITVVTRNVSHMELCGAIVFNPWD